MIFTTHQPAYLPWLGLFHKIASSDLYCILDTVQFEKGSFINRNKIKTANGPTWLTVPVETKGHLNKHICEIRISKSEWRNKHIKSIEQSYKKSPFFNDYFPSLKNLLENTSFTSMSEAANATLIYGLDILDIKTPVILASENSFEGSGTELIIDMCKKVGANHFIFGKQGENYADVDLLKDADISFEFQKYNHPVYPQLHGEFEPYMSFIDLLFNKGPDSYKILMDQ